jgi:cobalt/nickel transport system permease protein
MRWLNRLDGRIKIVLLVAALLLNLIAADGLTSLCLVLLGCSLILLGGVSLRQYGRRMLVPSILALVALLTQLVWINAGETVWAFSLFGFEGIVTSGGLKQGVELALRILAGMSLLLGFALTTPLPELMRATRFFRCPELLVELTLIMYRYIFLLLDEALRIRTAQRSRLGYSRFRNGIRSSGILGGMLLLRSFDRADRSFAAMRCRGYHGVLARTQPRKLLATDWTVLSVGLLILGGLYGLL